MDLIYLQDHSNTIITIAEIFIGAGIVIALLIALGSLALHQRGDRQRKMAAKALLSAAFALLLFGGLLGIQDFLSTLLSPIPNSPYVAVAKADAREMHINPDIYIRQINQESGFDPKAFSAAGAEGIAQFMPSTASELGINPWDPTQSLQGAAYYMASLLKTYHQDYAKALAAYNAGQGTVDQMTVYGSDWLSYMPSETQSYVHAILGQR